MNSLANSTGALHAEPLHQQTGAALLEALISLLLFSIGILGMVSLQGSAATSAAEAHYRSQASVAANRLLSLLWIDRGNLAQYSHFATSVACAPGGAASPLSTPGTAFSSWLVDVQKSLPGTTANRVRVSVGADQSVRIAICWRPPQTQASSAWHSYELVAYVTNGI